MTKNELFKRHLAVYRCNERDVSALFDKSDRIGYNSGIYGWNWDAYSVGMCAICVGCRNTAGMYIPHALRRKYNNLARLIEKKYLWNTEEKRALKEKLILRLLKETERWY